MRRAARLLFFLQGVFALPSPDELLDYQAVPDYTPNPQGWEPEIPYVATPCDPPVPGCDDAEAHASAKTIAAMGADVRRHEEAESRRALSHSVSSGGAGTIRKWCRTSEVTGSGNYNCATGNDVFVTSSRVQFGLHGSKNSFGSAQVRHSPVVACERPLPPACSHCFPP